MSKPKSSRQITFHTIQTHIKNFAPNTHLLISRLEAAVACNRAGALHVGWYLHALGVIPLLHIIADIFVHDLAANTKGCICNGATTATALEEECDFAN